MQIANSIVRASFCLLLPFSAWTQQYTISTFAGTGEAGSSGDNGPAVDAELNGPVGLFISGGNLYITDEGNQRIRLVSGGNITTIVGDGGVGYVGDGGAAIHAQVNGPASVALDNKGNLYIADAGNSVVRMVTPDGTISTIAGYVCPINLTTGCGPGYAGDGGPATAALLNNPLGVAVDPYGNVYIADSNNNVIRKISNGNISTLGSTLHFNLPSIIVLDQYQNLYITDTGNNRIVRLAPSGAATVVAGNGQTGYSGDNGLATEAELAFPAAVALDGLGNLYIADRTNDVIRLVNTNGIITTIAGTGEPGYSGEGVALNAELNFPAGLAVDSSGNVYVADTGNNRIRLLQPPAPAISSNGVVNAASYAASVSPGSLASVFGAGFGTSTASATSLPLPTSLQNVSVSVNGRAAPLVYVGTGQINFQVPWETAVGNAGIVVSLNGVAGNTATVPVLAASPGLFLQSSGAAIVQNSDYSLNQSSNPAAAGSAVIAYLTGSGPVSRTIADGVASPSSTLDRATSTVTATLGTQTAPVLFAGLAPGLVGVLQVNVMVPAGLAAGSYPLTVTVGGQASNSAPISVK
jgi:uncharacterized protein (TIGR03437 family)